MNKKPADKKHKLPRKLTADALTSVSGGDDPVTTEVSLHYNKIKWTY